MHRVDTRGMSCPQPVLMVKNQLKSGEDKIEVITDSNVATGNITRYAINNGYKVSEREEEEGTFLIISK